MKIFTTFLVKLWHKKIDFELIKSNFVQFEAIQADHKVTAASAVKYGGVVEALALATFGNHIGANVELADLDTSLTANWVDSSSHRLKKLQVLLRSDKQ